MNTLYYISKFNSASFSFSMAIGKEQEKILNSQLTILQLPMYWFSMPGVMKNYWEQVLEPGFAYPGKFEQSPLHDGRKIAFSITTQSGEKDYSETGVNGTIEQNLFHLSTAFRFVGYDILMFRNFKNIKPVILLIFSCLSGKSM